jgi:hypothetical protein
MRKMRVSTHATLPGQFFETNRLVLAFYGYNVRINEYSQDTTYGNATI